jgi:hypothetical protein
VAACAAPVVVLAGLWLLVTEVLLVPAVPGAATPPDEVVQFIIHVKGLPRLDRQRGDAFLKQQILRLVQDEPFRNRFAAEYRVSSPDEQKAFRAHLFDAFKPVVMADIRRFQELPESARQAYLDERIVTYNRLSKLLGSVQIDKSIAGPTADAQGDLLSTLLQKTTEEERQIGIVYAQALAVRLTTILADPELKAEFEKRIAAPTP